MKIIVSHDVDHLYWDDHLFDLIYPKLWIRESLSFLKGEITLFEWYFRMLSPFHCVRHKIDEVMRFDKEKGIPSVFFFGMVKGLGMSYKREKALGAIQNVLLNGFDVGVHGIAFSDAGKIQNEYKAFYELVGAAPRGIRMHYVRFDSKTLRSLSCAGYAYDSSEFDKKAGCCLKSPYKVDKMWEFPLCLMDTYLPYNIEQAKAKTTELLAKAESMGLPCFTVLFHDGHQSDAYSVYRDWYIWFINYCLIKQHSFISYNNMISYLEI